MKGLVKALVFVSRIIVGAVFTFSGFVKIIDPLGTTYKFGDYFNAFGMEFLVALALPAAFLMCALEFAFGITLMFNIKTKLSAWGVLLFMGVFTPLTLYLAINNPVSDCGCFGDAWILTNWETFWKNIIIDVFVVILFIYRNKVEPWFKNRAEWLLTSVVFVVAIGFEYYNYQHLPLLDFRPYSIGSYLPEKMEIPPDAPQPVYENIIVYTKDGEEKGFTLENLPDSTWEWVRTESILIDKGYEPPIHDFNIVVMESDMDTGLSEGDDITDQVLNSGFSFLLVAYDFTKSDTEALQTASEIAKYCRENGIGFYCMTSSLNSDIRAIKKELDIDFDCYATDEITLKTIVRANPGYVLLNEGTVIDKWHYNDIPEIDELDGININ